jgi:hypothetical protein
VSREGSRSLLLAYGSLKHKRRRHMTSALPQNKPTVPPVLSPVLPPNLPPTPPPVTSHSKPTPKAFNFKLSPQNADALQALHLGVVATANNHVLDYGLPGLQETNEVSASSSSRVFGHTLAFKLPGSFGPAWAQDRLLTPFPPRPSHSVTHTFTK